eukprot:m.151264 g.151264  ORF g.151264 m.151264 type:complete len:150 (-) comp24502_c0_seq3:34-483(-)
MDVEAKPAQQQAEANPAQQPAERPVGAFRYDGAINEKDIVGKAGPPDMGFLMHSIFGLNHYPNFLHRWSLQDITDLEARLEKQLAKVREIKSIEQDRRVKFAGHVRPTPSLLPPSTPQDYERIFHPGFLQALDIGGRERVFMCVVCVCA